MEIDKISAIASILNVEHREILALDTSSTFIYQPREDLESTKRAVYRDQIHFYNYYTLPAPKGYVSPVILDILCPYDRFPALNNGHFEEAITINLGPDDIYGRWEEDTTKTENYSIIKSNTDKKHWILREIPILSLVTVSIATHWPNQTLKPK